MDIVRPGHDCVGSVWTYGWVGFIRQVITENFGAVGQYIHLSLKLVITKAWGGQL